MKLRILMISVSLALAAPAWAAGVYVGGAGLAHDCFIAAKIGNVRDGLATCNRSLDSEPLGRKDKAATYNNRGLLLDASGRTDDAEYDFRQAMAVDPALGDPYINLGSMMIKKKDYAPAVDQISHGLELGSSFAWIGYYDRALAYDYMGRYTEAYRDYKKVLELEPHYQMAEDRLKDFTVVNVHG